MLPVKWKVLIPEFKLKGMLKVPALVNEPSLPAADISALAELSGGSIGRALELYHAGGLDLFR